MVKRRRPAWSNAFASDAVAEVTNDLRAIEITTEWAWGKASGRGVKVAVVDSGIDNKHPAIAGRVSQWMAFTKERETDVIISSNEPHTDTFGHGTACADIILRVAPDVELISIKVLGEGITGDHSTFVAGLKWCVDNQVNVVNLSLGVTKKQYATVFYELADEAYFKGVNLVTAANNMPVTSYPSLYASVLSVACHDVDDPNTFYVNPNPPVEFGAPGININVAWQDGGNLTVTGNSFAAPYISGRIACLLSKHPSLTPSQVKTVLSATASNSSNP